MNDALGKIRTRNTVTDQRTQVLGRDDQVKNNAGGYVFEVAGEDRIKRFLTLGTDGGTYYQKEQEYTTQNAAFVIDFAKNHGVRLSYLILDISEQGRAPRQNPALFALAAVFAFGDAEAKKSAGEVFNRIVRIGTHLFIFVKYTEQLRGWGRSVKRAVASWYDTVDPADLPQDTEDTEDTDALSFRPKTNRDLSYQMIKYRQRENWTHRDILRTVHPKTNDTAKKALFDWACGRGTEQVEWVKPYEAAQLMTPAGKNKGYFAHLIRDYPGLPWEALPDVALTVPETWEALIDQGMPITALIRQLPRLTNLGLMKGAYGAKVAESLTSEDLLHKGRVHPVRLLYALKTYAGGHSIKGSNTWTPAQKIVDALDQAFYLSFKTTEPTGKRVQLSLDMSASMTWPINMCGVLQAREGAAAMAMATAAVEQDYVITGFTLDAGSTLFPSWRYNQVGIREVPISPRRRLDDNLNTINSAHAGGTDCSLPMQWAAQNKLEFDTFVIYTDNETWGGDIQPFEALSQYRQSSGINAKLIVAGMSATEFTIADPNDSGMLDVAGFDADTPGVISGFSRGDFS